MDTIHTFLLVPTGPGVGLTSVSVGLVRALDRVGLRVRFLKPIGQQHETDTGPERSTSMLRQTMLIDPPQPIKLHRAEQLITSHNEDDLMEEVVALYQRTAGDADVVVVEGLIPTLNHAYADQINTLIARALDAEVILVSTLGRSTVAEMEERIELTARFFGGMNDPKILGGIINKLNAPGTAKLPLGGMLTVAEQNVHDDLYANTAVDEITLIEEQNKIFKRPDFRLLGLIPWQRRLVAPRTSDIAHHLQATVFNEGEIGQRRVNQFAVCASNIPNMTYVLQPGVLVITPGDRADIIVTASMAAINKIPLAGILVTGGMRPDPRVIELCYGAFETGLPALAVETDSYHTAVLLQNINTEVPLDDKQRIEWVMDSIARRIDAQWLKERCAINRELRLSPPAFRHLISERARQAHKRIILPEGIEPRTIQAAAICHERGIARCVLMGKAAEVKRVARAQGIEWPTDIEIIDPDEVRHNYVAPLVERRKHKGLSEPMALAQLEDNVVLGTMMLYLGEVDGLVSGAIHTTANTIRPALQLIKTKPGTKLVSSIFFMLLPEQVLVYGDCAINPNPNAEELADIAIQSADSAIAFNIPARVAMISYSTGSSGAGSDVEKVSEATKIAQAKRPDLLIDGPLQYDAAAIADVAATKAPNSPVAGKATVYVFPDLNTGNTTYKAVQRSAGVVSIGPMLQGLKKPVNDLSRGALVDDIVYTIALTAIQAA